MHFHSDNSPCSLTYYSFPEIRLAVTNHLHFIDLCNSDSVCFHGREAEFLKAIEIDAEVYRGADKLLAPPGRKQAQKPVRDARVFNNIETRAVIKFLSLPRQGAEGNSHNSDRNISLFPSWSG